MTTSDLKVKLEQLFKEHPIRWMKCIINPNNKEWHWLEAELNAAFPQLSDSAYTLHTKIYWALNGMTDFPKCEVCGNPVIGTNVKSCFDGYKHLFCSKACRYKEAHRHAVETNIKKYGVENPMQNKTVRSKVNETQRAFTPDKKLEIQNKRVATCMEKYGTTNGGWTKESQEKIKRHFKEKIGSESWAGSEEFKDKVRKTCRERYGADSWFGSNEFREKLPKIIKKKYGVENVLALPENRLKQRISRLKKTYEILTDNSGVVIPLFSEDDLLKIECDTGPISKLHENLKWKCQKCGLEFESEIKWNDLRRRNVAAWCPACFPPLPGRSGCERELAMLIETIVPPTDVRVNVRDVIPPLELDVYIPSKKIAFEFDGLFYHSEGAFHPMDKDYHLNKTKLCEKQGVRLIHIFENEWTLSRNIVESKLRILLNGADVVKIGARECDVDSRVPKDEAIRFLDENHLQGNGGYKNTIVAVGLRLKDSGELMSIMTFSKPRFDKTHEWELIRFCNKLNYVVQGGAEKMLSHFERAYCPKNIVSYADRRWTMDNGNTVYDKIGFKLDHISPPNYWYWKPGSGLSLESRMRYQKYKLPNILEHFNPERTEIQNMLDNGFRIIYDCGNLVYVKNSPT